MRLAVAFLLLTLIPNFAYCGAWTQPKGDNLVILSSSYYSAGQKIDNQGNTLNQPSYQKYELNPYYEYGLTDAITLGANLFVDLAKQNGADGNAMSHGGVGDSEFFLRGRVWQRGGFVMSLQPMIKLPSPEHSTANPKLGGSHPDAGMGLNNGYGFDAFGQHHFVDVDTMFRHRFGPPKDQVDVTASFGAGITQHWTLMPQLFVTHRTSSSPDASFTQSSSDDYNLVQAQLSAIYALSARTSLQAGVFTNLDGKNTGKGQGVVVAWWRHF